jgi:PiT family inorganic phosphate transporter
MDIFQTTFPNGIILIWTVLIFGFYMAWNIGANDVANAMGTSVGSKALTIGQAVIIAAIFELLGAVLVGGHVTDTVRNKMFEPSGMDPQLLVFGFIAALLAASIWLQVATAKGWPVSTTHSIVGAIIGIGIAVSGDIHIINWSEVTKIVASWITSPLSGGILAFLIYKFIQVYMIESKDPVASTARFAPVLVFFVGFVLSLVTVWKGLKNLKLDLNTTQAVLVSLGIGLLCAVVSFIYLQAWKRKQGIEMDGKSSDASNAQTTQDMTGDARPGMNYITSRNVERIFSGLLIVSAAFLAFAHGANDVANAVGPVAGVLDILNNISAEDVIARKSINLKAAVPLFVLVIGGVGIVVGLATWGYKVIETIGTKITELTPSRGVAANIGAATTIVLASKFGMPISTTHTLIGAVIGVGMARGSKSINLHVLKSILLSWIITIPAGATLAVLVYYILKSLLYIDPTKITVP